MEFTPEHQRLLELHLRFAAPLEGLLAVHLPDEIDRRFRAFHDTLNAGEPLSPAAKRTFDGAHHVREGLTAGVYHLRKVERIEREVMDTLAAAVGTEPWDGQSATMGLGARTLTFEYHAFVFALRATFDYLSKALIGYFRGRDCNSFRRLPNALNGAQPEAVASRLQARVDQALSDFEDVLGRDDERSTRDRIAHVQPLDAGQINVSWVPGRPPAIELVGGAEGLEPFRRELGNEPRLTEILDERLTRFEPLVFELLGELPELSPGVEAALSS
jgi:hypothetical protein